MKPLIKWSGGKADEIKNILEFIPKKYDTYIEPFVGGGALYFYLENKNNIINDNHKDLINFYKCYKNNPKKIYDFMKNNLNNEDTYYKVRNTQYKSNILKACQFYYLRKTCYRGMLRYNSNGKFNVPFGRYNTINYENLLDKNYKKILDNTEIYCEDFEKIFELYGNNENNFCFIDQPYDSVFINYGFCEFNKKDQERLFNCFKNTKMKCLMVIGETEFIKNLYKDYIKHSYPKKYKFKLHSNRIDDTINRNHLIVTNY